MAVIRGTPGDDLQVGTNANDRIVASPGRDIFDPGGGFNFLDYRDAPAGIGQLSPISVFANTIIFDGFGTFDRVVGPIEAILGSSFGDVMEGDRNNNLLRGLDGDDDLKGGEGDDLLDGGSGNDRLEGEVGLDVLIGRQGDDVLIGSDGDTLLGGNGNDVLRGTADSDPIEMRGQAGDDVMSFEGDLANAFMVGGSGDDLLVALNSDGGRLFGGSGDDVLYLFSDPASSSGFVAGGPGDDVIELEVEFGEAKGGSGCDTITGFLDVGTVRGGRGEDFLSFSGTPTLFGGRGDDVLIDANQEGFGPLEDFLLWGGPGNDFLQGGPIPDVFMISARDEGTDIMKHFASAEDILRIEGTGLCFDDFDTNGDNALDACDDVVTRTQGDLTIDIAAAAGFNFLNTVTLLETLTLAAADVEVT